MKTIRATIAAILYLVLTIFVGLLVLLNAFIFLFLPTKRLRLKGFKFLQKYPVWWIDCCKVLNRLNARGKIKLIGTDPLDVNGWYMLISNHRSWLDIILLGDVFNRKIPTQKFFMKKSLLWKLPVAGLVCYILGYPFMERHTREQIRKNPELKGKDIETTKEACNKFKLLPNTVINFVEGTRFTQEKHDRQSSPFKYLLKPKAGGTAVVVFEMREHLTGIVNVTIDYEPHEVTLWHFLRGDFDRINIHYEVLPITEEIIGNYYEDREFRSRIQQWLNDIWQRKDTLIAQQKESSHAE